MAKYHKEILVLLLIILVISFIIGKQAKAGSGDNVYGWAWSENIGWISFNSTSGGGPINYGVHICASESDSLCALVSAPKTGKLIGYAWSDNIGWISFADFDGDGDIDANDKDIAGSPCAPNCEAELNLGNNEVSGWARALANGDGWDGWIKLRGTIQADGPYGVWLDRNPDPDPDEFREWAWGDMVVGWISFNHLDCDPNGDGNPNDGPAQCVDVEPGRDYSINPIPNYKVMTDIVINRDPDQPATLDKSWDYCGGTPSVNTRTGLTLNWSEFSDDDINDTQQAYEVEIAGNSYKASVTGSSYSVDPLNHGFLEFTWGNTYNWRVRVQDNNDNWSNWSDNDSFTMPSHQAPNPSFTASPTDPPAGVEVTFTDESKCYTAVGVEYDCKDGGAGVSYSWDFGDDDSPIDTTKGDTTHTYPQSGDYIVRLEVTGSMCSCVFPLTVFLPLPTWKEIAPF